LTGYGESPRRRTGPERLQLFLRIGLYATTLSLVLYLVISRYAGGQPDVTTPPAEAPGDSSASTPAEKKEEGQSEEYVVKGPTIHRETSDEDAILDDVMDGSRLNATAVYYLLHKVIELGDDDVTIVEAPQVSTTVLEREPDRWRGQPVSLTGTIQRVAVMKLSENPSGVRECWDAWAASSRGGNEIHLFRFICPKQAALREGQTVRVRGLFLMIFRYATEKSGPQAAPVIVCNKPVIAEAPGLPTIPGGGIVLIVLVGLLVVYFLLMVYVQRRKKYMYERLEARRKAVLSKLRQEEAGEPEADAAEDEPDEPGAR